jgi:ribosomal protein L40E
MFTVTTTTVYCRRCKASFEFPALSDSDRVRIVDLVRRGPRFGAMQLLHRITGIELRDAKGVVMHMTLQLGICHRCHRPLPSSRQIECPKCDSLYFDW